MDMMHGRSLVFCSDEHADAERTKAGHFRMRPKRANTEEGWKNHFIEMAQAKQSQVRKERK